MADPRETTRTGAVNPGVGWLEARDATNLHRRAVAAAALIEESARLVLPTTIAEAARYVRYQPDARRKARVGRKALEPLVGGTFANFSELTGWEPDESISGMQLRYCAALVYVSFFGRVERGGETQRRKERVFRELDEFSYRFTEQQQEAIEVWYTFFGISVTQRSAMMKAFRTHPDKPQARTEAYDKLVEFSSPQLESVSDFETTLLADSTLQTVDRYTLIAQLEQGTSRRRKSDASGSSEQGSSILPSHRPLQTYDRDGLLKQLRGGRRRR